jgi:hypothetical protein
MAAYIDITNAGYSVYPTIQVTTGDTGTYFSAQTYEGYGVYFTKAIENNKVIIITQNKSAVSISYDGVVQNSITTFNSAPFALLPGVNRIYFSGVTAGTYIITYYQRHL